jgi:ferredoxin
MERLSNSLRLVTATEFAKLIKGLIKDYTLYGTIDRDGTPAYAQIEDFKDLKLRQRPSHLSPKEFLFPPEEKLLTFDIEKQTSRAIATAPRQAIIGLAPCDLRAISLMDAVFKGAPTDPNYTKRRRRTILIGADCAPDEFCFCSSVGSATAEDFDLFLHILKHGFLIEVGSKKGSTLLKKYCKTRLATTREIAEVEKIEAKRIKNIKTQLNASQSELPAIYSASEDDPVWEQIGARCTGCGSCNHVCPTCYCFDLKDTVALDLQRAERSRHWDACTMDDFAKVAGGHDFRATRAGRLRHRMRRKFQYPSAQYDALFCVGCGRCSRTCLVDINIAEVTNDICANKKT